MLNAHQKWEFIKHKIRHFSIRFSKRQAQQRRIKRKELFDKIKTLEQTIDIEIDPNKIELLRNEVNIAKKELEHLEKIEAYGHYVRSKAFFLENDQKNSAIFFSLEKKNYENKNIKRLTDKTGKQITKPNDILQATVDFYQTLYDKDKQVSEEFYDDFFKPCETPKLDDNVRDHINRPFTEYELKKIGSDDEV